MKKCTQMKKIIKLVDHQWNRYQALETRSPEDDETVLIFSTISNRTSNFPQILQVQPPTHSGSTADDGCCGTDKSDVRRFLREEEDKDLKPCTYLDCSGLKVTSRTSQQSSPKTELPPLLILHKCLTKVQNVKVLLIVPYTSILELSSWTASLASCDFVLWLLDCERGADGKFFGLVVVKQVDKNKEKQSTKKAIFEFRSRVCMELTILVDSLRENSMSDKVAKYQYRFLETVLRSDNILVLEQDPRYGSSLSQLVNLPSPPGYKILKLCQRKMDQLQVTDKVCEAFWQACLENKDTAATIEGAHSFIKSQVLETAKHTVFDINRHYSLELVAHPQRHHHAKTLAMIIKQGCKMLDEIVMSGPSKNSTFSKLITVAMKYPKKYMDNLKIREEQLKLLSTVVIWVSSSYNSLSAASELREKFTILRNASLEQVSWEISGLTQRLQKKYDNLADVLTAIYDDHFQSNFVYIHENRIQVRELLSGHENQLCSYSSNKDDLFKIYSNLCSDLECPISITFMRDFKHLENELGQLKNITMANSQTEGHDDSIGKGSSMFDTTSLHVLHNHIKTLTAWLTKYDSLFQTIKQLVSTCTKSIMTSYQDNILCKNLASIDMIKSQIINLNDIIDGINVVIQSKRNSVSQVVGRLLHQLIFGEQILREQEVTLIELNEHLISFMAILKLKDKQREGMDMIRQECLTQLVQKIIIHKNMLQSLVSLKKELSSYDLQRIPTLSNFPLTTLTSESSGGYCLRQFINLIPAASSGSDMQQSYFQLDATSQLRSKAHEIIVHALQRNITLIEVDEHTKCLEVTGNFVKFSDFVQRQELREATLKEIRVFATETVFIDLDLYARGRELTVTIIAPRVEIINKRLITLDGQNGADYSYPAGVGRGYDCKGGDGLPGRPGENAGNTFLLCNEMLNASGLEIVARGGCGGNGQDGGDGHAGRPGQDAVDADFMGDSLNCSGRPGSCGSNGGNGGKGGFPGYGGSVVLKACSEEDKLPMSSVKIQNPDGTRGNDGGGGGGKWGDGLQRTKILFWTTSSKKVVCRETAPGGNRGLSGVNIKNMVVPSAPQLQFPSKISNILTKYRKFTLKLATGQCPQTLKEFMEKINENQEITRCYVTPKSIALDLLNLELELGGSNCRPDILIAEHEHFQRRLALYPSTQMSSNSNIPKANQNLIGLLYAMSVSKTAILKESRSTASCASAQVVNLQGYFDVITETVKRLKSLHLELNRRDVTKQHNQSLDKKCSDAMTFISTSVLPALAEAEMEMTEKISRCQEEVEGWGLLLDKDRNKRITEEKSALERAQKLVTAKKVLSCASLICHFLPLPLSPYIVLGINAATVVISSIQGKDKPTPRPNIEVPKCMEYSQITGNVQTRLKAKLSGDLEQIQLVFSFLDNYSHLEDSVRPLLVKWRDSITDLEKEPALQVSDPDLYDLAKLDSKLEESSHRSMLVEELQSLVDIRAGSSSPVVDEEVVRLEFLLVQLHMLNCDPSLQMKLANADFQLEKLKGPDKKMDDLIQRAERQLESISSRNQAIYKELLPLVKCVMGGVTSQAAKLEEGSRRVNMWKVHGVLRDLRGKMSGFLKGLESEEGVIQSVQKVEETISLVADLYEMIDKYEESKKLADTMASLTSQQVDWDWNDGNDEELCQTMSKLKYLLRANIFALDYNQAMSAFKQWVFPYASRYFETSSISLDLLGSLVENFSSAAVSAEEMQSRVQNLSSLFISKFEELRIYLGKYRSMTLDTDSTLFTGYFSSSSEACPPFFLWTKEEYGKIIDQLLDGKEVDLRADIWKATKLDGGRRAAIKFKMARLYLRHKNGMDSREQEELENSLKDYMVTMVHPGISYYRVLSTCFVMRGERNEFCYSVDQSTRNVTCEKNETVGDYLLSPYTLWRLKLTNVSEHGTQHEERYNNNPLTKFKGSVDLELRGHGLYLDEIMAKDKKLDESYLNVNNLKCHYEIFSEKNN